MRNPPAEPGPGGAAGESDHMGRLHDRSVRRECDLRRLSTDENVIGHAYERQVGDRSPLFAEIKLLEAVL